MSIIKGIYECIRRIVLFVKNTFSKCANKVFTKVGVQVELEIIDEEKELQMRTAEKKRKVNNMLGNTLKSKINKNIREDGDRSSSKMSMLSRNRSPLGTTSPPNILVQDP